jgi:hypothetical protein
MQYITGVNCQQTNFYTLEDQLASNNAIRLIDAFVVKLDLAQLGFTNIAHSALVRISTNHALKCKKDISKIFFSF